MMARREAGRGERWPKALKEELENNSRKPRDPSWKTGSDSPRKVQLTLSYGKKKKGNEVAADEDDDDAVRGEPVYHKTK
jgi:hypothetical protein